MSDEEKKVMVNGQEEDPIRKVKIPPKINWEEIAREKQRELEKAMALEVEGD